MKEIKALVVLLSIALTMNAQTAKELKKSGTEAYETKNYPKAFIDYSKAISEFEKAGTIDTALYYNTTYIGYKSKNYEKLIPYAEKTIKLGYKKANIAYYILAKAYKETGNNDKYIETLKKGHEAFPNDKRINKTIAIAYINEGLAPYDAGAKIVAAAEKFRTSDVDKYKAEIKKANEKFEESKNIFEKAYKIAPKNKQLLKALKAAYESLNQKDKALKIKKELEAL